MLKCDIARVITPLPASCRILAVRLSRAVDPYSPRRVTFAGWETGHVSLHKVLAERKARCVSTAVVLLSCAAAAPARCCKHVGGYVFSISLAHVTPMHSRSLRSMRLLHSPFASAVAGGTEQLKRLRRWPTRLCCIRTPY